MAGHTPWREIKHMDDGRTPAEREVALAEARAEMLAEIDAYNRRLGELRRARSLTQSQLADSLGVSQAQVSRIESQADIYLSTLARYVEAMGGELEITARFEGEEGGAVPVAEVIREPVES